MPTTDSRARHAHRAERQFGLVVGSLFFALGSWWLWRRGITPVPGTVALLGSALVVLGLTAPKTLVHPFRWWMALAEALSFVSTRLILGIVFFGVVTPLGVVMRRMARFDPLRRRGPSAPTSWHPYSPRHRDRRHYEKMF